MYNFTCIFFCTSQALRNTDNDNDNKNLKIMHFTNSATVSLFLAHFY